ncbi:hypothetical protein SAMN06297387_11335 [Streptomyces zhaozhouensis]|uniref:SCO6045-like C-terminal domain-containing protein n=1 Tax=Streptomyces zhaozhouensis TaxID=1300267 RepID=A0A286DYX8_9ACTN|nr:hypothetical protein SAMN06297387_11335 [Streptomyces zhaozhouensis]
MAEPSEPLAARRRLAAAQDALLASLVAGAPPPAGFHPARLDVQRRALVAKRAGVLAKVAPELPEILGAAYRPAVVAHAARRPLTDGYRHDALALVRGLLGPEPGLALEQETRRRLTRWLARQEPPTRRAGALRRAVGGMRPRARRKERWT